MSFQTEFQAHFDDCDPAGIVFFANHFKLAHRAIEEFVVEAGIEWKDWFQSDQYGAPLIHAEADYKTPMLQGQKFHAKVRLIKIGESSVEFETTFEKTNGDICSVVKTVHVFINTSSMKKQNIPDNIRKKLEPLK